VTALVISVGVELLVTDRWTRQFFPVVPFLQWFWFAVHAWEDCPVFPLEIDAIV